ncbi:MAG: hypothetical protein WCV59_00625 [Parcubacteria group bacterium]|jgi:hypothetical protein
MEIKRGDNQKERKSLTGKFKLFFKGPFLGDKINLWLLIITLVVNIINWLILLIFLKPATENIILHYNVYFGVDMTGKRILAFILPAIGLLLIIINSYLAKYFHRNNETIAGYILLIAALMAQLSLIIASFSVIIINY